MLQKQQRWYIFDNKPRYLPFYIGLLHSGLPSRFIEASWGVHPLPNPICWCLIPVEVSVKAYGLSMPGLRWMIQCYSTAAEGQNFRGTLTDGSTFVHISRYIIWLMTLPEMGAGWEFDTFVHLPNFQRKYPLKYDFRVILTLSQCWTS